MSNKQETFGYIGLGNMGAAMATNLQKHFSKNNLPAIVVYNRTVSRADPVRSFGASVADSAVEVVRRADIILTCLSNDAAVLETYTQLLGDPAIDLQGKIFVEQSTVYPSTMTKVSEQVRSKGAILLACPIFGEI
ncbi:hypothetical protein BC937DRAFT_88033 [Endogone sp. FLAS-F59071]|nr:hypothetical protein BC937DRAFT_88033 [Endogone sp. FLAS-F59071]|eukprot:RUS19061.1 hypothetical protein BC937DRAFT_88033 [Endogone sp. FLAS-F59071]